jgi:hypothetical protein
MKKSLIAVSIFVLSPFASATSVSDHLAFASLMLSVEQACELQGMAPQKEYFALACFHIGAISNEPASKELKTLIDFCSNEPGSPANITIDAALLALKNLSAKAK